MIFVIWFFDREGERLRYEICRDDESGAYVVVVTAPDGSERIERLDKPTQLIERSTEEMRQLHDEGWKLG